MPRRANADAYDLRTVDARIPRATHDGAQLNARRRHGDRHQPAPEISQPMEMYRRTSAPSPSFDDTSISDVASTGASSATTVEPNGKRKRLIVAAIVAVALFVAVVGVIATIVGVEVDQGIHLCKFMQFYVYFSQQSTATTTRAPQKSKPTHRIDVKIVESGSHHQANASVHSIPPV